MRKFANKNSMFPPWLIKVLSVNTFHVNDGSLMAKELSDFRSETELSNI